MAHRKDFESWLEKDCNSWKNVQLELISVDNTSYQWYLTTDVTQYEINYNDVGYITLSSLPCAGYLTSEVREIYQGDTSEKSYKNMISVLSDNFVDCWI